jgi:ferredoxin
MRAFVQAASAFLTNGYLKGFVTGKIFNGPTKHLCVPTLNCYSCPGALFACPVGAVQVILAGGGGVDPTAPHTFREKMTGILSGSPLYVIGFLMIIGALIGRATCGWVCPFGWLQDLVHKIPVKKFRAPRFMSYLRYVFLIGMVILMPLFWVDKTGMSGPAFCELACPAGTLEGGILLPLLNHDLRGMLGKLFAFKVTSLVILLVLMAFFARPFCSWICPLGAFLGPFNRISLFKLRFREDECVHCHKCRQVCPSGLDVETEIDTSDCIRCLECANVCPKHLIRFTPGKETGPETSVTPEPLPRKEPT